MHDVLPAASLVAPHYPFPLPPLRFAYDALAPGLDQESLRLHHDVHHRAYLERLNDLLADHPQWHGLSIEELLRRLRELPEAIQEAVRRQGGGHANHQFFWKILTPQGVGGPSGDLARAIDRDFGSFPAFQSRFEAAALGLFGSGWIFLVCRPLREFRLEILVLPDQGSVLTEPEPAPGLLCCDLWEHAYCLDYRDRRAEWLSAWWRMVHWDYVGQRLAGIRAGRKQL